MAAPFSEMSSRPPERLTPEVVREDSWRLYQQRLDQERAAPIEGTEGGWFPFFSPDGAWIGFAVGRSLKRVSLADGDAETIAPDIESGLRRLR